MFAKLTEQEKISLNPCGVKLPLNYLNFQYYTIKISVTTEPIRKLLLFRFRFKSRDGFRLLFVPLPHPLNTYLLDVRGTTACLKKYLLRGRGYFQLDEFLRDACKLRD